MVIMKMRGLAYHRRVYVILRKNREWSDTGRLEDLIYANAARRSQSALRGGRYDQG